MPILFLLDEFPRLGKNEKIAHALATLRSKKITLCLIIQSLAQLDVIYNEKEREVICGTCSYKAILNATDVTTQEYFSKLVGKYYMSKKANSTQYGWVLEKGRGVTESKDLVPIIEAFEFVTLRDVVLITPFGFFIVDKKPFYETQENKKRNLWDSFKDNFDF